MAEQATIQATASGRKSQYIVGLGLLLVIAGVGLATVKWAPYLQRSFDVSVSHTLGASIVSGKEAAAPEPSVSAAIDYAVVYFQKIWQALLVGLLLAATVDALLPRDWLIRVLGSGAVRSSFLGGLLALPGMM